MVPDACKGLLTQPPSDDAPATTPSVDPTAPNDFAIRQHEDAIEQVVATLLRMDAVPGGKGGMSGNEIYAACGIRKTIVLAAIKGAARDGKIANEGNSKTPSWVVMPF